MNVAELWLRSRGPRVDVSRDVNETAAIVYGAKKSGGTSPVTSVSENPPEGYGRLRGGARPGAAAATLRPSEMVASRQILGTRLRQWMFSMSFSLAFVVGAWASTAVLERFGPAALWSGAAALRLASAGMMLGVARPRGSPDAS